MNNTNISRVFRKALLCLLAFIGGVIALLGNGVNLALADQNDRQFSHAELEAVQTRFAQALRYQKSGNQAKAIESYSQLIDEHSDVKELYINLAAVYAQAGQFEQARQTLEAGLKADQSSTRLFAGLQAVYGAQAAESYYQALGSSAKAPKQLELGVVESLSLSAQAPIQAVVSNVNDNAHDNASARDNARLTELEQRVAQLLDPLRSFSIFLR